MNLKPVVCNKCPLMFGDDWGIHCGLKFNINLHDKKSHKVVYISNNCKLVCIKVSGQKDIGVTYLNTEGGNDEA